MPGSCSPITAQSEGPELDSALATPPPALASGGAAPLANHDTPELESPWPCPEVRGLGAASGASGSTCASPEPRALAPRVPAAWVAPWAEDLPLLLGSSSAEPYCPGQLLTKASQLDAALLQPNDKAQSLGPQLPDMLQSPLPIDKAAAPTFRSELLRLGGAPLTADPWACPTMGSLGHYLQSCKPCAFVNTKGCKDGSNCRFCHLCEPGEKKRRKKAKTTFWRTANRLQRG